MTRFIDFEDDGGGKIDGTAFELLIVGAGAAGLTIARELSGLGLRLLIVESGGLEETPNHEALNAVDVPDDIGRDELNRDRDASHAYQMRLWRADNQRYGVRCRVFGGSTVAWAGKVAPFDAADFAHREWVPHSGWPLRFDALAPYITLAAKRLDVGPLLTDHRFWTTDKARMPHEIGRLTSFSSYFWQIARSPDDMTDVLRFGAEFRRENHKHVTVVLNATTSSIKIEDGKVIGVEIISSLSGRKRCFLRAGFVVLAAGAVENARLLLVSKDNSGVAIGNTNDVVGRYLMDHPCMSLGRFTAPSQGRAAAMFGFFTRFAEHRAFMYSHGLSLNAKVQKQQHLTNMAVYANVRISHDDPIQALKRLAKRQSEQRTADFLAVTASPALVVGQVGRMLLGNQKLPRRLRRSLADLAVLLNANFVARDYMAKGSARKIDQVTLDVICEQPPSPQNRVTLSEQCDRLGIPIPRVIWDASDQVRHGVLKLGALLAEELERAGIDGFQLSPALASGDASKIVLHDMGHSAGTTRMGLDVASSVVDTNCQVHGVKGLYVAGASVFPTSGHANPTMVIMALAIRLADHLRERLAAQRLHELEKTTWISDNSPLVLVTGATGNLGTAVVEQLLAKGYRVRGQFHRNLPNEARVEWLCADFSKDDFADEELDRLVTGVTAVIHLAASLPGMPATHTTNVVNLERLARACVRNGVKYFGQASSMVVYGSPSKRLVTESDPLINPDLPLEKQYFESGFMREYAQSKRQGEDILSRYAQKMKVDLYRIALAQGPGYLEQSLAWGRAKRFLALYRNSHYISTRNVARAVAHLLQVSLNGRITTGLDAFNIADINSPTYKQFYRRAGKKNLFHVPLVFDLLKNIAIGRCIPRRFPMGFFRLDNSKLRSTGFELESDWDSYSSNNAPAAPPRHHVGRAES
ncbi:GMC oxidoreductase [Paraburkholderia phymatum]|uniref:NAD-dependent epimerase/dehydratase n=1 Tax=Paraburkholderia phymatum (strain DSM 17167 / CIP 108236 / LMG 21445 / STM815) TaxID=391038 RepID=B2JWH5_PARP8|nr:GMC oxidoreductase [Paraburkholderia phymatum]ACC75302.1 NAD-dependent epimerase/dehydratase [Paraburkholderia phymatum STM815]